MPIHQIFINSNKTENFKYQLAHVINNINAVYITDVKIPLPYNVKTNTLNLVINNVNSTINIEKGFYDVDTLITAIQTQLTALNLGNTPTLAVNKITGKITFSVSSGTIKVNSNELSKQLGFSNDSENAVSVISDSVVNLQYEDMYITCNNLYIDSETKSATANIVYGTNINDLPAGIYTDKNINFSVKEMKTIFQNKSNISSLNFSLVDKHLNPIDLNGLEYSFTFNIMYQN